MIDSRGPCRGVFQGFIRPLQTPGNDEHRQPLLQGSAGVWVKPHSTYGGLNTQGPRPLQSSQTPMQDANWLPWISFVKDRLKIIRDRSHAVSLVSIHASSANS